MEKNDVNQVISCTLSVHQCSHENEHGIKFGIQSTFIIRKQVFDLGGFFISEGKWQCINVVIQVFCSVDSSTACGSAGGVSVGASSGDGCGASGSGSSNLTRFTFGELWAEEPCWVC